MDTPIRVFLKKLRSDNNEVMGDMAEKLGVTTSFLSAVELGKKNPPDSWIYKICKSYNLTGEQYDEFRNAIFLSQRFVKIDLTGLSREQRAVVLNFKGNLKYLSNEDLKEIRKIFKFMRTY